MNKHRLGLITALGLGAVLVGGAIASAQPQPYEPPAYQPAKVRKGITLGASLGVGELSCEDESANGSGPCDGVTEAGSIDGHVGIMLSPRLAIMGDVWAMGHSENDLTMSQTITTAAAQLWLTPRLWIKGGLGFAHARFSYDTGFVELESESDTVPAGIVGIGYELIHRPNFALDLALKAGTGIYRDDQTRAHNVAVTIGANWF